MDIWRCVQQDIIVWGFDWNICQRISVSFHVCDQNVWVCGQVQKMCVWWPICPHLIQQRLVIARVQKKHLISFHWNSLQSTVRRYVYRYFGGCLPFSVVSWFPFFIYMLWLNYFRITKGCIKFDNSFSGPTFLSLFRVDSCDITICLPGLHWSVSSVCNWMNL